MASALVFKVTCLALICMVLGAPMAMAALTCCQVKPAMEACEAYVRTGGDTVPTSCCYAVISLINSEAMTTLDRQTACRCIQEAAWRLPDLNATAFASVPEKCGIRLPFQFSHTMDCNRV